MAGRRIFLTAALVLVAAVAWAAVQAMSVQIKQAQIREQPTFLSPVVATAAYGQKLHCLEEKNGWFSVMSQAGDRGWVHKSALTTKAIAMNAGDQAADAASGEEMVLAGKGFNKQVESAYRANNGGLAYKYVDSAEKDYPLSDQQLMAFLQAGQLEQGGAQ